MSKQTANKNNQGQSGPQIEGGLHFDELNENEQTVVSTLDGSGTGKREYLKIKDIQVRSDWEELENGNSRVRNALRRLVRAKWVEHEDTIGDGTYRITEAGRKRMRRYRRTRGAKG